MDHFSYKDPPIEVIAASPRLEMIMSRLGTNGLRPILASTNLLQSPLPLLIDIQSAPPHLLKELQYAVANRLARPVILLCERDLSIPGTLILGNDSELVTLASRLASHARKALREREIKLRNETAIELGIVEPQDVQPVTPKLLYLGDGSAYFLSLQSALRAKGVDVTAALSVHTAMDYLQQHMFSSILVDLSRGATQAVKLLKPGEDNLFVSGLPVFVCLRDGAMLSREEMSALSQATEIIDPESTPRETAEKITRQVFTQTPLRPISSMRSDTGSLSFKLKEISSGLFSRRFLEAHMVRQIDVAETMETDLAILTLKLKSSRDSDNAARAAMPEFARLVGSLLRETDCAASFDETTLVLCLPNTNYSGAIRLAKRILSTLGGDKLGADDTPLSFGGSLSWRAVERRQYHTATSLLDSALSRPFSHIRAA